MDNNREQFRFDDDLMALAGLSAPTSDLYSEDEMPAASDAQNAATRIDAPKVNVPKTAADSRTSSERIAKSSGNHHGIASLISEEAKSVRGDSMLSSKSQRIKTDLPKMLEELAKKSEIHRCVSEEASKVPENSPECLSDAVESAAEASVHNEPPQAEAPEPTPEIAPDETIRPDAESGQNEAEEAPAPIVTTPESPKAEAAQLLKDETENDDHNETEEDSDEHDDGERIEPVVGHRRFTQEIMTRGRSMSRSLVNIGGTKQRSGRFWVAVFAACIIITLVVTLAHYKHREIMIGYELSTAINEREALLEENRRLRIELRVLNSHEKLNTYKDRQLGLQPIQQDQIIFINHKPRTQAKKD